MISLWYFPTCMNISLGLEGIAWAWTSCNLLTNYPECGDIHFGCNLQEAEHVGAPKMSNCCHLVFCMRQTQHCSELKLRGTSHLRLCLIGMSLRNEIMGLIKRIWDWRSGFKQDVLNNTIGGEVLFFVLKKMVKRSPWLIQVSQMNHRKTGAT